MSIPALGVTVPTGQPPRHASAEPEARHVACFFRRFVCRVSTPAQQEKGAGIKTRVGRRLPLVAVCAGPYRTFWWLHFLLGPVLAAPSITGDSEAAAPFVGR